MDVSECVVLVIEDQFLVAMEAMDALESIGARPIGPVSDVRSALDVIESQPVDAGLVDLNLEGEFSYPAIDALLARGARVVIMTGYDASAIEERYRNLPILRKPLDAEALRRQLGRPGELSVES